MICDNLFLPYELSYFLFNYILEKLQNIVEEKSTIEQYILMF